MLCLTLNEQTTQQLPEPNSESGDSRGVGDTGGEAASTSEPHFRRVSIPGATKVAPRK